MSTLSIDGVSRWFGNVVAVNDVTMTIGPGITGLLGPNGAGKSTLINMLGGFLAPSTGTVTLDGATVWRNPAIYSTIGLVPEREAAYDFLTGRQFVLANAELHGLPDPGAAARRALETVEMEYAQERRMRPPMTSSPAGSSCWPTPSCTDSRIPERRPVGRWRPSRWSTRRIVGSASTPRA